MRLRLRFILFFIGGLVSFIMFTGLFVLVCSEYLIPHLAKDAGIVTLLNITTIPIPFLTSGVMFGLFFVNSLVYMIPLIRSLSLGDITLSDMACNYYFNPHSL